MEMKDRLQKLVQRSYAEIRRFAGTLSAEEKSTCGKADDWTARDVIAHLAAEKKRVAAHLNATRLELPVEETDGFEAENAKTWEAYKDRSFEEIMGTLDEAQEDLLVYLASFQEADLYATRRYPWLQGRPLWRYVAGIDFLHTMAHLGPLYIERGERDYAERLRSQEARMAGDLDDSPGWQGVITYNLACHHALMGEKDVAIDELKSALRLAPNLVEWAWQDGDLVSLQKDRKFKKLIAELTH